MIKQENLSATFDNEVKQSVDAFLKVKDKQSFAQFAFISNVIKQNNGIDKDVPLLNVSFTENLMQKIKLETIQVEESQVVQNNETTATYIKKKVFSWKNPLVTLGTFLIAVIALNFNIVSTTSLTASNNQNYDKSYLNQTIPLIENGKLEQVSYNAVKASQEATAQELNNKINVLFRNYIELKRTSVSK